MKKVFAMFLLILAFLMLDGCTAAANLPPPAAAAEPPVTTAPTEPPVMETQAPIISREEATAIALDHAGFTADQVSRLECELDKERGGMEYEIDFHQGNYEYNYDIHGETGEILYWEKEVDD